MFWQQISRSWLFLVCCVLAGFTITGQVFSQPAPPSSPIPRVAPGKHFGFVTKIDISGDGRYAITVAEDKTALVWDLESRRLHRTLRVPIAAGHEGRLYVGAVNHDASLAAVAGFTGISSGSSSFVYIFDLKTGEMGEASGFAYSAIDNLLFSRDGRFLSIAVANGGGVYTFDLSGRVQIAPTFPTPDRIYGIEYGADNSLIVSSIDGSLHRYSAPDFELVDSTRLDGEPMHLRYSPDDSQIAVGYRSSPKVSILDADSLREIRTLDASSVPGLVGLIAAEWSDDGQYIFAGGRTAGDIETPLLRWDLAADDPPETILMAPKRIGDIHRTGTGNIVYVSGMPTIGLVTTDGQQEWLVDAATADIRADNPSAFQITPSGVGVRFPYDRQGTRSGYFNPVNLDPSISLADTPTNGAQLISPAISHPDWKVDYENEVYSVGINGRTVELEQLESPRVHTFARDGSAMFLGTAWFLYSFDSTGNELWRTELTGEPQLLNTSINNNWIVTSLSDGTIRWFRTSDGQLVLSLFPHANGEDWIAWIPEGYYMSSLYGDELIGWHINKGWKQAPEFYKAVQFERVLYRPDVVQEYFHSYGDPDSIKAILGDDSFTIADLASIAPPSISASTSTNSQSGQTELQISADGGPLSMEELSVYVNGIPVNAASDRLVAANDASAFQKNLALPLQPGDNQVRVEISNGKSIGIEEFWVDGPANAQAEQGDLYMLTVGVSQFADDDVPDLRYAAKDARDIAAQFAGMDTSAFRNVYTKVVADETALKPDGKTIRETLDYVQQAGANDTVVLFFASHGLTVNNNYYFAPTDARIDPPSGQDASEDDLVLDTFLQWEEIFEPMRLAAGRRLMIVDTCASGDVSGPADLFNLQKRSASSKIAFMTASAGNQLSQELNKANQGLFTYTVLEALRAGYDPDGDGLVALNEVFDLSSKMVPSNRSNKALPQTPQLMAPDFLASMTLTTVENAN